MGARARQWADLVRAMLLHLRQTEAGSLLIAAVDDGGLREEIGALLTVALEGQVLVREYVFDETYPSLAAYLRTLAPGAGREAVLVQGLAELSKDARTRGLEYLKVERESLRLSGRSIVLFVTPDMLPELVHRAPDFWSWRSGVFEFRSPSDEAGRERELAALRLSFGGTDLAKLRKEYLRYLVAEYQWVDFRGLLQVRNIVRLPLDRIYVPLSAVAEAEHEYAATGETERLRTQHFALAKDGSAPTREARAPTDMKVELKDALAGHDRLVVAGDPGSGKSTLLKHVALNLARGGPGLEEKLGVEAAALPVLLPIAAYADARQHQNDLTLGDFMPRYFVDRGLADMGPLFRHELKRGRCLVLLDGLDEVVDATQRRDIAESVTEFVGCHTGNRFIITTRIAGYRRATLEDGFVHLTVSEFGDEEIERFVQQWCYAYETMDGETPEAKRRAERRERALLDAINSDPAVRRLAVNPLLLTILALIHYQGVRLPHRRVELYRLSVEALAETWNLARSLSGRPIDMWLGPRRLDERYVVGLLAPVAFWMHENRPGGPVARDDLEGPLTAHLVQREGVSPDQAANVAHDFVDLVCEQSGLLIERGFEQFAFMHLTFEEYLAARHMAEKINVLQLVGERLHSPGWREVILLTAGLLRGEHVDNLVISILEAGSPYEDLLHRDLLMAGACLADDVQVDSALREHIIEDLCALWFHTGHGRLFGETRRTLVAMRGTANAPEVAARLLGFLGARESYLRAAAALDLGRLREPTAEVVERLLYTLRDRATYVRSSAAEALSELGITTDEVIAALLRALQEDRRPYLRARAATALAALDGNNTEVTGALLRALGDHDEYVRDIVGDLLSRLADGRPFLVEELARALHHQEPYVRDGAAMALRDVEEHFPDVVRLRAEALEGGDARDRLGAVRALAAMRGARDLAIPAVLRGLEDDDPRVREISVRALADLGAAQVSALSGLLRALGDRSRRVRDSAGDSLRTLAGANAEVTEVVLQLLRDPSALLRARAAEALRIVGERGAEATERLLLALEDPHTEVRAMAAASIAALDEGSPQVMHALLRALRDAHRSVRLSVIEALTTLGEGSPEVAEGLLQALGDRSKYVRASASRALGQRGETRVEVTGALRDALGDEHPNVAFSAAEALAALGSSTPHVIQILLEALHGGRRRTRARAAAAFGHLATTSPRVIEALFEAVSNADDRQLVVILDSLLSLSKDRPEVILRVLRLAHGDRNARWAIRRVLPRRTDRVQEVVAGLLRGMEDPSAEVRALAADIIGSTEPRPEITERLVDLLEDESGDVRLSAVQSLRIFGDATPPVIAGLVRGLRDSQAPVRGHSAVALAELATAAPEVMDPLASALLDETGREFVWLPTYPGSVRDAMFEAMWSLAQMSAA